MTKVVIQCAGWKSLHAGYFHNRDGHRIVFVAHPSEAPQREGEVYSRPDDLSDDGGQTWRQRLLTYNAQSGNDIWGLLPAWQLYRPGEYGALVDAFGTARVYILSAGWGLIRADFLTPYYDITLSRPPKKAELYKWRRPGDDFEDYCHLPAGDTEPVIFMGGESYRPLFERLTSGAVAPKTIYYRAEEIARQPGFAYEKYESRRKTNWHYSCVSDLIAGEL